MDLDDLLSPYRGFRPPGDVAVADAVRADARRAKAVRGEGLRAQDARVDREEQAPELLSPESWEMYDFVKALTA